MMSRGTVEFDFFGILERDSVSSKSQFHKFIHSQRGLKGIQSAISKINPELLRTILSSSNASVLNLKPENVLPYSSLNSLSVPTSPNANNSFPFPSLPLYVPNARTSGESVKETTPLTIFYNGNVSVFDVPHDKAESILKIVTQGSKSVESVTGDSKQPMTPLTNPTQLIDPLNGDLPMSRRKSLQRFLEKRKERLTTVSPYGC